MLRSSRSEMSKARLARYLSASVACTICISADAVEPLQAEPVGLWDLAKVSIGLVIVLATIVAVAAGLKRVKSLQLTRGNHMKILDGLSLGSRERVVLIEVERQRVLLGIAAGQIQALHVFDGGASTPFVDIVKRTQNPIAEQQNT